ncbi:hypothetical protein TrispH2_006227 [Trichoplax sp. H2]|nr:hypothetical protein TrispH2_006227 [Trichoplax sp. H2]|eukprot:RDD41683.1 hypothetical protein TrispH2_006227 [Trichoplax sp. H2]
MDNSEGAALLDNKKDYLKDFNSQLDGNPKKFSCLKFFRSIWPYLQVYFILLASIQGFGLLALPDTLSHSGIQPFIAVTALAFVVEVSLSYYFLAIVQKASAIRRNGHSYKYIKEDSDDKTIDQLLDEQQKDSDVNLHMIAESFLPSYAIIIFDVVCFGTFFTCQVANVLSGSQAYGDLFNLSYKAIMPIYVWIGALLLIFGRYYLVNIISTISLIRCGLLTIMNDWHYVISPLFIALNAMGGTARMIPYLINLVKFNRKSMIYFFIATVCAQFTAAFLNIMWSYAVLYVVPQTCSQIPEKFFDTENASPENFCNLTLEWAKATGSIATTPLTTIFQRYYPQYQWTSVMVKILIMLSVTVSYLSTGLPLATWGIGVNKSIWKFFKKGNTEKTDEELLKPSSTENGWLKFTGLIIQVLSFASIYVVSLCYPQGFYFFSSYANPFFVFLLDGIFMIILFRKATSKEFSDVEIPFAIPTYCQFGAYLVSLFFIAVAILDFLSMIKVIRT